MCAKRKERAECRVGVFPLGCLALLFARNRQMKDTLRARSLASSPPAILFAKS